MENNTPIEFQLYRDALEGLATAIRTSNMQLAQICSLVIGVITDPGEVYIAEVPE